MESQRIVSPQDWRSARMALLEKEKAFTRLRDELSAARRALPWERVTKDYRFAAADGERTLAELFDGRTQLAVYHFMFGPDWINPCKSCSWWADNFERNALHLRHRDVTLAAVSRAPVTKLQETSQRFGWTFPWYSSDSGDFNYDFGVSFSADERDRGAVVYNYAPSATKMSDLPGISVFCRDEAGAVYHTYSCYGRGLENMNAGYAWLDLTPKGRDEDGLPNPQAWVRHRDSYDD